MRNGFLTFLGFTIFLAALSSVIKVVVLPYLFEQHGFDS